MHIPCVCMIKFKFLAHLTLPTQSCQVLYSFCANLQHSLIMWLMVSSLSLHCLHLLFCCVLSIVTLIWLILMALFCAAIRRDSVSLLKFPFLNHIYLIYMYKEDLALNNLQWLICHKTQPFLSHTIQFSALLPVSYNPSLDLYWRPKLREDSD